MVGRGIILFFVSLISFMGSLKLKELGTKCRFFYTNSDQSLNLSVQKTVQYMNLRFCQHDLSAGWKK